VLGATGATSSGHAELVGYQTGLTATLGIALVGLLIVTIGILRPESAPSEISSVKADGPTALEREAAAAESI